MLSTERQELFDFYQGFESPILNITSKIECKNFKSILKEKNISLFQYLIFNLCKTVMDVESFQYRYDGKAVYKINQLIPSYTVMRKTGNFNFCTFKYNSNLDDFLKTSLSAKEVAEQATHLLMDDLSHRDYIFMTCLPWFQFSSIQHPIGRFKDSTIPSFAFGKIEVKGALMSFPLSIQVHHGLVDGVHIHEFMNVFKSNLESVLSNI
jgi:chloramphenicol O-acetyltransferase type A